MIKAYINHEDSEDCIVKVETDGNLFEILTDFYALARVLYEELPALGKMAFKKLIEDHDSFARLIFMYNIEEEEE